MSVEDNKELVRFVTEEGLNKGNLDFVDRAFAPEYHAHSPGLSLPRGSEAFRRAVALWRSAFPDFHVTIEDMVGEGDMVVSRFTTTGTHRGSLMGIPPTGQRFSVSGADVHRVVDGRVVESWLSDDVPRILMEIGILVREAAAPVPSA